MRSSEDMITGSFLIGLVRLAFLDFGDTGRKEVFEGVGTHGDVGGVKGRPLLAVEGLEGLEGMIGGGMGTGDVIEVFAAAFGTGNGVGVLSNEDPNTEASRFVGGLIVGGFS